MLREAIVVDCPGRQIIPSYATDFEGNFLAPGSKKNLWRSCQYICTHFYFVHISALISLFQKNWQMRTHIKTILLTLYHSDRFQPSKGHPEGVWMIHVNTRSTKSDTRCKIQLSEQRNILHAITRWSVSWILHLVTHFVDLVVEMYQSLRAETCRSDIALINWC
jgi:hypothetical protein